MNWRKFGGIHLPPYQSIGVSVVVIKVFFIFFSINGYFLKHRLFSLR